MELGLKIKINRRNKTGNQDKGLKIEAVLVIEENLEAIKRLLEVEDLTFREAEDGLDLKDFYCTVAVVTKEDFTSTTIASKGEYLLKVKGEEITSVPENIFKLIKESPTVRVVSEDDNKREYFKKIFERKDSVSIKDVEDFIYSIDSHTEDPNGRPTTITYITLLNGFVITESSTCINREDYNDQLGEEINIRKAKDKIWELLAFALTYSKMK